MSRSAVAEKKAALLELRKRLRRRLRTITEKQEREAKPVKDEKPGPAVLTREKEEES